MWKEKLKTIQDFEIKCSRYYNIWRFVQSEAKLE